MRPHLAILDAVLWTNSVTLVEQTTLAKDITRCDSLPHERHGLGNSSNTTSAPMTVLASVVLLTMSFVFRGTMMSALIMCHT